MTTHTKNTNRDNNNGQPRPRIAEGKGTSRAEQGRHLQGGKAGTVVPVGISPDAGSGGKADAGRLERVTRRRVDKTPLVIIPTDGLSIAGSIGAKSRYKVASDGTVYAALKAHLRSDGRPYYLLRINGRNHRYYANEIKVASIISKS